MYLLCRSIAIKHVCCVCLVITCVYLTTDLQNTCNYKTYITHKITVYTTHTCNFQTCTCNYQTYTTHIPDLHNKHVSTRLTQHKHVSTRLTQHKHVTTRLTQHKHVTTRLTQHKHVSTRLT